MALIGTLRNKMGTWVVIFVFVAIVSFILNDLLGNNSILFDNNDVGEIAGHEISLQEYQSAVEEREQNYILNFNRQPGDREMATLRDQAWEILVLRHAIQREFDKIGVEVTVEEQEDMVYGKNVDENIRQAFTNPNTGEFDRARLVGYLNDLRKAPADPQLQQMWSDQRNRWEVFQRDLVPGRQRIKYENLLLKTNYVTKAEAEREYHAQTDVAEVKYLYIPYYTVSDSAATVSDADLRDYYGKNKSRFKTEESRDVKYVSFPIVASPGDTLEIRNEMNRITQELKESDEDSAFAVSGTDGREGFGTYNLSSLPSFIKEEDLRKGNVIGPVIDRNAFKVVKITAITKDTTFNARASHILIKWDNETEASKKAAKEKARGILKEIRAGADFAEKARQHGTDGTATKGGDLGWFSTGRMVKEFEDAAFKATKPGLLNDVVETQFGYHIIKVTNTKDNTAYKIATIERVIAPSDETTNAAYRRAETFLADMSGLDAFEERAKKESLAIQEATGLKASDRRVGNLGDARQIVQWAFRDAKEGDVSEVIDLQDEYVVAILTGKTEKGYKSLESVKKEITPEARKEVQAKLIIEKLKGATGTLEEIARAYGTDANVYSSSDTKLVNNSLPTAGFDPKVVGVAFSLEGGKRSEPVQGENGVFIIEVQNITPAPAIENYQAYKETLLQNAINRSYMIAEAIKEHAKIEDKRYKFY